MSDEIFESDKDSTNQTAVPNPAEEVFQMIGPDKYYKSVQDADKALAHQLNFIETLKKEKADLEAAKERELEELRSELAKRDTLASAEDILNQKPASAATTDSASSSVNLSPEAISKVAEQVFESKQKERQYQSNLELVTNKLKETYGIQKAKEIVAEKSKSYNIDIKGLAKSSPQAALDLLMEKPTKAPYEFTSNVSSGGNLQNSGVLRDMGDGVFDFSKDSNYTNLNSWKDKLAYVENTLKSKR